MFAAAAVALIGFIALSLHRAVATEYERINEGDFGITAIALAQSLVQEAMGKYFDANPDTSIPSSITSVSALTPVSALGHAPIERYRSSLRDFNDFDDYNNLFIVFKSNNPADTASTPGSDWETIVPNIKAKIFVKARVQYVKVNQFGIPLPDSVSAVPTWHKKLTVSVIDPTARDTLRYAAIMSYWP